jgi:hypothetical protein
VDTSLDAKAAEAARAYADIVDQWRQLEARLDAKLKRPHRMDWELVKLEFRRDLWLLALSFEQWTRYWDREFDDQRKAMLMRS